MLTRSGFFKSIAVGFSAIMSGVPVAIAKSIAAAPRDIHGVRWLRDDDPVKKLWPAAIAEYRGHLLYWTGWKTSIATIDVMAQWVAIPARFCHGSFAFKRPFYGYYSGAPGACERFSESYEFNVAYDRDLEWQMALYPGALYVSWGTDGKVIETHPVLETAKVKSLERLLDFIDGARAKREAERSSAPNS